MGINVVDQFSYKGPKFNFERDGFQTLAEMKDFPETSLPPKGFKAYCAETDKDYKFDIDNSVDPQTGKWREYSSGGGSVDLTGVAFFGEEQESLPQPEETTADRAVKDALGNVITETYATKEEIIDVIQIKFSKNGYYLNGIFYSDDFWRSTPLVYIKGIIEIEITGETNNPNAAVAFFDKDKKHLKTVNYGVIKEESYPENAMFVAASTKATTEGLFKINKLAEGLFIHSLLGISDSINNIEKKQNENESAILENKQLSENNNRATKYIISDVFDVKYLDSNLYNPDELLLGWYIKNNEEYLENKNGIMSGKIILKNGQKYASQGIQIGSGAESYLYGANFDSNDNFLGRFLASEVSGDEPSNYIFTFNAPERYAYSRIMFQNNNPDQTIVPFSKDYSMLEEAEKINPFIPYGGRDSYTIKEEALPKEPEVEKRSLYIEGASFAYSENGWFELACEKLGLIPMNKAVSGSSILDFANKIYNGTAWTDEEFEKFDILAIMHVHNYNVADEGAILEEYTLPFDTVDKTPANYAQAYDYVLKEYAKKCYECKDKPESKWYGQKMGKPFKVICCTHWHDARVTFNTAIRELQKKWGFELCEFDKHVGFTKNQVNPATNEQWSILYCNNSFADTEVIEDVTYGWHPTRGKDSYIQHIMSQIFYDKIQVVL